METAPADGNFSEESPLYEAWYYDHFKNLKEDETEEDLIALYNNKASLFAEYGRIVAITIGAVRNNEVILKSFSNEDEAQLLRDFNESVSKFATNKTFT